MASPTVRGTPAEGAGASATTHTITFAQNTGDRVVIFLANDATARTWSLGDSFTDLTNTSATFHIFTKVLDGSEGGNMVATAAVATKSAWVAYNITAGTHASGTVPVFSTAATGTSTAPNAGSLTPTGGSGDYLWLTAFGQAGEEADDDTWVTGTPTSFSNLLQKASGTTGAVTVNCQMGSAQYAFTGSVLDAAAFTTAQSLAWRAYTVAIYGGVPVTAAAGTGAASNAGRTVSVNVTAATGTGTASNAHIPVWTWGTYSATFSNATGTALNVSVTAATGTGAAADAGRTTGPAPVAATGTGTASNAGRTAGIATTAATGTGAATNPAVSLVAALNISVTAATGTGTIVSPAFSVSRSAAVIAAVGIGSATL